MTTRLFKILSMFYFLIVLWLLALTILSSCNAQPRSNYEIESSIVNGAVKYHFFLEKKSASNYSLIEDMDYLQPDVTNFRVSISTTNKITVNLPNDGSEYKIGVVVENSQGFYSGMTTALANVGTVPNKPSTIIMRKL